jgi:FtsP/CotA-like multicopper oxidase with cupredoxin domain
LLVDESLSLHWHGLHMRGANHMDGPVGVNQCAIPANGGTFKYEVPTGDQAGTFWYHSHSEMQRADGLYGGLVVHAPVGGAKGEEGPNKAATPAAATDEEILLLIGDWYQFSGKTVFAVFEDPTSNGNEPVPGSVLINGRGAFECSKVTKADPVDCHSVDLPALTLDKRLRYRVRMVNVGVLTGISTTIPDARIDVLTVDGGLPVMVPDDVKGPAANSIGVVYPAQRVDFLLSWPDASTAGDDTQLIVAVDGEYYVGNWQNPPSQTFDIVAAPALAKSLAKRSAKRVSSPPPSTKAIELRNVHGAALTTPLPEPDKLYMIFAVVEILSHNQFIPKGYINHTMWIPQDLPLLSLDRSAWDSHQLVPWTGSEPAWVELTINNIDTQGHPFHLHGFDFYVVGSHEGLGGWDYYNPFFVPWKPPRGGPMNTIDPILRDTVYVPPYGYVILRFRADNEGIWVLHCHILWHQASGMNMAFQVLGHNEHGLGGTPQSFCAAEYCRTSREKHPHV